MFGRAFLLGAGSILVPGWWLNRPQIFALNLTNPRPGRSNAIRAFEVHDQSARKETEHF